MPQRGDIVVERLTGRRAMVIQVGGEEVTCRFTDGRLEDRFLFEIDPAPSVLISLLALVLAPFFGRGREAPPSPVAGRVRPLILRQPGS